jgi:ribosomal protein S18 acetylase RimI-like enzyme
MIHVELAKTEDSEAIFNVQRLTWLNTYPNLEAGITKEDVRRRIEGEHGELIPVKIERLRKRVEMGGEKEAVFIVKDEDKVVGFVAPAIIEGQRRIGAIYVLPDAQGKGIGSRLLQKAIEWHGGGEDIFLHVASYNQKTIEFYKKYGFHITREVEDNNPLVKEGKAKAIPSLEMVLTAQHR